MKKTELEKLIEFQQGELDAVYMYQKLAGLMKKEEDRELLLSLAADEGRHAGVLKQYTGAVLKPKKTLGDTVAVMYKALGRRLMFTVMSNFEYAAYDKYATYYEKYPELASVGKDEIKHGDILKTHKM